MTSALVLQRSWVQIPYWPEFFSGLISTTTSVVFIAARITSILVLVLLEMRSKLEQIKLRYKWSEKVVDWSCSISWDALFWSVLKDVSNSLIHLSILSQGLAEVREIPRKVINDTSDTRKGKQDTEFVHYYQIMSKYNLMYHTKWLIYIFEDPHIKRCKCMKQV